MRDKTNDSQNQSIELMAYQAELTKLQARIRRINLPYSTKAFSFINDRLSACHSILERSKFINNFSKNYHFEISILLQLNTELGNYDINPNPGEFHKGIVIREALTQIPFEELKDIDSNNPQKSQAVKLFEYVLNTDPKVFHKRKISSLEVFKQDPNKDLHSKFLIFNTDIQKRLKETIKIAREFGDNTPNMPAQRPK